MIKKFLIALTTLLSAAVMSHAATGCFGSYIGINANGGGNVFYGCQQPGPTNLTAFDTHSFGTFTLGQTLVISGGELETFKNGASDVTGAVLNWKVNELTPSNVPGTFAPISLGFTANATFADAAGNSFAGAGDQKWAEIASTPNVLAGLTPGTYNLEVYFNSTTAADGDQYSNNGNNNFKATFTVVPEPSTVSLLVGSSVMGGLFLLRKRRA
jgi:hypothetical protein